MNDIRNTNKPEKKDCIIKVIKFKSGMKICGNMAQIPSILIGVYFESSLGWNQRSGPRAGASDQNQSSFKQNIQQWQWVRVLLSWLLCWTCNTNPAVYVTFYTSSFLTVFLTLTDWIMSKLSYCLEVNELLGALAYTMWKGLPYLATKS